MATNEHETRVVMTFGGLPYRPVCCSCGWVGQWYATEQRAEMECIAHRMARQAAAEALAGEEEQSDG